MDKIWNAIDGKKSYIVAFMTALLGLLQAFGVVMPEWLLYVLAGMGIGTLKHAVSKLPQPPD